MPRIKIGLKEIDTNIFLAPLSACSDLAFRLLARSHGAKFCFFEMIDSRSLKYGSPRSERILRTCPQDQPIAAQLLGSNPEEMLQAAQAILKRTPVSFIDINAACPARKVFRKGAGSCFLQDAVPLYRIIERMAKALPIPITVKMRVGLSEVDIPKAVEFAKGCESAGASALFVHGRTRSQENYGPVHYGAIRAIKNALNIPIFGSGNILNPPLAKKMFDETGCDGILIAKGSFGNPFIFQEIETYLETGIWNPTTDIKIKLTILIKHLSLIREIEGARQDWRIGELGRICLWYLKGFVEASRMRARIFTARSDQELLEYIQTIEGN